MRCPSVTTLFSLLPAGERLTQSELKALIFVKYHAGCRTRKTKNIRPWMAYNLRTWQSDIIV